MALANERASRRSILRGLALIPSTATLTLVPATNADAYNPGSEETRARYRAESEDVKAFYRTNGYETLKKK